ncbi:hypothetical protein LDG_7598 [Legionella drancourtii LLAP12]|uniref:Uncharacterized protein n=1 Tax=Legionella drancourtii LLAP12 TaxID=658187 RepID=G9EQP7_9GAMM|nr:hypothetical protein LDG_7598 [Legionella drancourtii LLAP12]
MKKKAPNPNFLPKQPMNDNKKSIIENNFMNRRLLNPEDNHRNTANFPFLIILLTSSFDSFFDE